MQCVVIGNMRAIGRWSVCAFMWLCCCDDLIVVFVDISRNEQRPVARVLRFLGMWHPRRLFAVVLATATILLISLFERSVVLCELGRFGIDQAARQPAYFLALALGVRVGGRSWSRYVVLRKTRVLNR